MKRISNRFVKWPVNNKLRNVSQHRYEKMYFLPDSRLQYMVEHSQSNSLERAASSDGCVETAVDVWSCGVSDNTLTYSATITITLNRDPRLRPVTVANSYLQPSGHFRQITEHRYTHTSINTPIHSDTLTQYMHGRANNKRETTALLRQHDIGFVCTIVYRFIATEML